MFELTERHGNRWTPRDRRRMFKGEREFRFLPTDRRELTVWTARLGSARLCRVESTGHRIRLDEPAHYTVLIPRTGIVEVRADGRMMRARPGETLVFPPNARTTEVLPDRSEPYRADCVLLPAIGTAANRPARGAPPGLLFGRSHGARADASLRDYCAFLYAEAARAGSGLSREPAAATAAALLGDLVFDLLSQAEPGSGGTAGLFGMEGLVRRAEEIMAAQLAEPLTIEALARMLGLSPRRLQQAFRSVRGRTPREILSELRLEAARRRLGAPLAGDTVAAIALDCGFAHFGRFARAYALRFGESPSDTLRRA